MDGDQNQFLSIHSIWELTLSAFGVLVMFILNRAFKSIDGKADQQDVTELRREFNAMVARQDQMHADNTKRLDNILLEITGRRRRDDIR